MVRLADPEVSKGREAYLAELAKFKDMMTDCNTDGADNVSVEEGAACLKKFVSIIK